MWVPLPQWLRNGEISQPIQGSSTKDTDEDDTDIDPATEIGENAAANLTPKAYPIAPREDVPQFSLTRPENGIEDSVRIEQNLPTVNMKYPSILASPAVMAPPPKSLKSIPSSFPAPNSAQRVGGKAAASNPQPMGLMAPPASAGLKPTLRTPSIGPLPNRGPPMNSQQRARNSSLDPTGITSTPNARGKVILSPGHSPMDWAALMKSRDVSGVSAFQRVTPSQLRTMTGRKGKPAWSSWQGKVYNITPYLPFHPGGESELMKAAGRDGTKLFMDVHPWVNWENMLGNCLVGVIVPENFEKSELEDMD
nr:cytochrome b5 reductase 4 [Quercus suber]